MLEAFKLIQMPKCMRPLWEITTVDYVYIPGTLNRSYAEEL